jgi:hypothetical protein
MGRYSWSQPTNKGLSLLSESLLKNAKVQTLLGGTIPKEKLLLKDLKEN